MTAAYTDVQVSKLNCACVCVCVVVLFTSYISPEQCPSSSPLLLALGKTFAFMDIDISERELQQCCSVYSKAKWKGETICIQPARESFLTRRERECREGMVESEDQKTTTRSTSLVKRTTVGGPCKVKAIGKWTKGTGGRMLPVVRMHVGGSKVMTYNPSHHSHQVKQLSSIGSVDTPVASLTWALDCEGSAGEDDTDSEGSAGEDANNSEGSTGEENTDSEGSMLQVDDKSHRATLEAYSLPNDLPPVSCTPVVHAYEDSNTAPILDVLLKQCQSRSSGKMRQGAPTASGHADDHPLPPTTCRILSRLSSMSNDSNLVPIMETLKSCPPPLHLKEDTVDVNAVSSRASRKREQSEEQRRKAVEEMAKRAERSSWQHTSVGPQPKRRIVFSSSSDDGSSSEDEVATVVDKDSEINTLGHSVSDSHVRMALFDSSDSEGEEGEENPEDELISEKPQFEGKAGARLFKLQQKFSRDKRFQLDERFLSDSESDVELQREASVPPEEEDASLRKQIQEERMMQNSIIDQILGLQSVRTCPQSTMLVAQNNLGDFLPKRYDPTAKNHTVMEFDGNDDASVDNSGSQCDVVASNVESSDSSGNEGDKMVAQAEDLKEQYYSIQGDLKDAFHQKDIKDGDGSTKAIDSFSFAALFDSSGALDQLTPSAADHGGVEEMEEVIRVKPKASWWLNSNADSSSGEECDDAGSAMNDKGTRESGVSDLFFFHSHSDQLCNRLDGSEGAFMRQKPLDELEQGWPQLRVMYKQSYKQRRRDALRWSKKMKGHRN